MKGEERLSLHYFSVGWVARLESAGSSIVSNASWNKLAEPLQCK